MRDKDPYRYLKDYENRRTGYYKQLRERSQTFVSNKFDFEGGDWSQLNNTMIPSLGMTIRQSISALKKSWKMYRINLSRGEPTDQLSLRLLKLQAGLGLEQTDWLKEGLLAMGYTPSEIEAGGGELDAWETEEVDSEWTEEDRQLLAEEKRENDNLASVSVTSVSEEFEDRQTEWTDLDQRMAEEKSDSW